MLRLNLHQPTEPFWVEFADLGVRLQLRPLTLATNAAMDSYVRRRVADLARDHIDRVASGAPLDGLPDWQDPDIRAGHTREMLAVALARFGIVGWEGVGDMEGEPLPLTPGNAEALARHLGDRFVTEYQAGLAALVAEGNASGAGRNGASAPTDNTAGNAPPIH
jgi:hypothetical protein